MSRGRGLVLGLVAAMSVAGGVHQLIGGGGPKLTGTCDGACDHYMECKSAHTEADGARCRAECPDALGNREARMEYESLPCTDAVEYVDGSKKRTSMVQPAAPDDGNAVDDLDDDDTDVACVVRRELPGG